MKRLSVLVLSASVLGLGLRVFADPQSTPAQSSQPKPQVVAQRAPAAAAPAAKPAMAASHTPASTSESENALVKQYCTGCHNDRTKNNAGGLSLQTFDAVKVRSEEHTSNSSH